jgi:murein DD-endopeptidase MepM/ murein hydrolase activator NlpD
MNRIKTILNNLRLSNKYAISNPINFEEKWSFNATGIQLISLISIGCLLIGVLFTLFVLKGPFSSYFTKNDITLDRNNLENQHRKIVSLNKRIDEQDAYIASIKRIISGDIIADSLDQKIPEGQTQNTSKIQTERSENEAKLSAKVKDDLRTNPKRKKQSTIHYFVEPVNGFISQDFNVDNHPGIDIVAAKDKTILACLSGTVIYSGYTQKDGYVLILDHANGYISVYKHTKTVLKKLGSKVQMSDPIAIVGNTGENTSGPHLHFELWYNQSAVNPKDYMNFK